MTLLLALLACSGTPAETTEAEAPAAKKAVVVSLNWYPEPEFGGLYQARELGLYSEAGMDVDIQPGGAGAPVISQVATGRSQFGVSTADEVVLARAQGADVVAVFATYQTHPACIMVHKKRGVTGLDALKGGTLALEDGIPFAQWLYKKYPFTDVTRVPYGGGVTQFLLDEKHAQQAYVTSEPLLAKKGGADPDCFMVADTGYNPYANVLITSGQLVKADPELVRGFVRATVAGWDAYLRDGTKANEKIGAANPTLEADVLQQMWEVQKPLVQGGHAETAGLGAMEEQRWATLVQQLQEIGALKGEAPAVSALYTNEFLPNGEKPAADAAAGAHP